MGCPFRESQRPIHAMFPLTGTDSISYRSEMNQFVALVTGLLIIAGGANSSFAAPIEVQTGETIKCETNAECKTACEEIGGTWKPNPGGSTHGTCTKKLRSAVLPAILGGIVGLLAFGGIAAIRRRLSNR